MPPCGEHDNTLDNILTSINYGITSYFSFSAVKYGSDSPCTPQFHPSSYPDPDRASLEFTATHEYAETVTDPSGGGTGWYAGSSNLDDGEIGDKCQDIPADKITELGNNYVTSLWDNSNAQCEISLGYDSPALGCPAPMHTVDFDFWALYTENASAIGCPLSEKYAISGGFAQDFTHGKIYSNGSALPDCGDGRFSNNSTDQNIRNAYNSAGGIQSLGCPFDNGRGVFVHNWNAPGANAQDFSGGTFGPVVMVDGPQGTFFLDNGVPHRLHQPRRGHRVRATGRTPIHCQTRQAPPSRTSTTAT